MIRKEQSDLTDNDLLEEGNKIKPSPIIDALLIGFLFGIIIYSVAKNTWGLVTLIPLFIIYTLLKKRPENGPKRN